MESDKFPKFNWGEEPRLRRIADSVLRFVHLRKPPPKNLDIPDAPYDPHKPVIRVIKKDSEQSHEDWPQ